MDVIVVLGSVTRAGMSKSTTDLMECSFHEIQSILRSGFR